MKNHIALLITLLLLLAVAVTSLVQAIQAVKAFGTEEPIPYTEADGKVRVILPSGACAILSFERDRVSIAASTDTTYRDAVMLADFIKGYAKAKDIKLLRSGTELIGEYRLHTMLAELGYRTEHTEQADIEYDADHRWYVNAAAVFIGWACI